MPAVVLRTCLVASATAPITSHSNSLAGGYILGDSAYPLHPWLLPPYRQTPAFQPWMQMCNTAHSKQGVAVEGAFGILRGRFQRLYYIDVGSVQHAVEIVVAACVLDNMATRCCDTAEELAGTDSGTDVSPTDCGDDGDTSAMASSLRDRLAQAL
ncbi:hypothetical protein HPB48_018501 [Haemaphysalis longicornis]|uniref:DDE Tnp4 domain-containing protein n=1 Tax=Haemaphysalis longicornis TaxID=44386 RepID=A0A9J6GU86_HAELO|nr:hypothetical protein HPB48_018501 [Haemaphysalis longicornis]